MYGGGDDGAFPVECIICSNLVPLDQLNDHELTCAKEHSPAAPPSPAAAPPPEKKPAPRGALGGGKKAKEGKAVRFSDGGGGSEQPGKSTMVSGSGAVDPTALPESYTRRKALQNKIKSRSKHVGLLNQGATCYLNSLVQTLFMTPDFRHEILRWAIPEEMRNELNVPYQLQCLFTKLEHGVEAAVETKALTKSFRWTSGSHFAQHDVQELNRVLFEALQKYIDHLQRPQFLTRLFEGKLVDYIQCSVCGAQRERVDTFQDITVAVQAVSSLTAALDAFCEEEVLEGGNAIFCESCLKNQPSKKGLKFRAVPPVLTVQMRRFDFDMETLRREKVYTDVEVPHVLDLSHHFPSQPLTDHHQLRLLLLALARTHGGFLPPDVVAAVHGFLDHNVYALYSVLAHRGTTSHGHYIAYIRDVQEEAPPPTQTREADGENAAAPTPASRSSGWYTFNDEWVEATDECALLECIDPAQWQQRYDELNPPKATGWDALDAAPEPARRKPGTPEPSPPTTPPPPPVGKRPVPPPPTAGPLVSFDTSAVAAAAAAVLPSPGAVPCDDPQLRTPSSLEVHPDRGDDLRPPSPAPPLALTFDAAAVSETVLYAWEAMGGEIVSVLEKGGRVIVAQEVTDCPLHRGDVVVAVDEQAVPDEAAFYAKIAAPAMIDGGMHFLEVLRGAGLGELEAPIPDAPSAPSAPTPSAPDLDALDALPVDADAPFAEGFDLFADSTAKFSDPPPATNPLTSLTTNGLSHRIPGQSSRMYPYMAVYVKRGRPAPAKDAMPGYMTEWVDADAAEFQKMQDEYDQVKDVVELKVYGTTPQQPFSWMSFTPATTMWEATQQIAAAFAPEAAPALTPDTARVRYYAEGKGVPGRTVHTPGVDVTALTLAEAGLTPLTAVVLEVRAEGDPGFADVYDDDVKIFVSQLTRKAALGSGGALRAASRAEDDDLYNADGEGEGAAAPLPAAALPDPVVFPETNLPSVVVPATCTLRALLGRVAAVVGVPMEELVVAKNAGSHTAQVLYAPAAYAEHISPPKNAAAMGFEAAAAGDIGAGGDPLDGDLARTYEVFHGDVLWCESAADAVDVRDPEEVARCGGEAPSPFNSVNHITRGALIAVRYHLPDEPVGGTAHLLRTQQLTKCHELRASIAHLHRLDPAAFTMRCSTATGRLMKDEHCIRAYSIGKDVTVKLTDEKPLDADDRLVELYYQPANPGPAVFLKACVVKADALLADFKREVCELAEVAGCGITPDNARLRKVLKDKKLKLDKALTAAKWGDNILGQTAKIAACVQKGAAGEALPKLAVYLLVRRYFPETKALSAGVTEVVVMRKGKMGDLKAAIAAAFGIDDPAAVQLAKTYDAATNKPRGNAFALHKWKSTSTTDAVVSLADGVPDADEIRGIPFADTHDLSWFEDDALVIFQDKRDAGAIESTDAVKGVSGGGGVTLPPVLVPKKHQPHQPAGKPTGRPERKEVGIVIRTEWDTTPTEANLEPPPEAAASSVALPPPQPTLTLDTAPAAPAALETCELADLTQTEFSKDMMDDDPGDCKICYYPFEEGQPVVVLNCGHLYHSECLAPWVKQKAVCPECGKSLFWSVEG